MIGPSDVDKNNIFMKNDYFQKQKKISEKTDIISHCCKWLTSNFIEDSWITTSAAVLPYHVR